MGQVHFGYDRAGLALDAYDAVKAAYGTPEWVGRYTELIPGTSNGLTVAEVAQIHAAGLAVCLCYNGATPTDVASVQAVGKANAAVAVKHAQAIGTPIGVALFVDIEAGWSPSVAFLIGWIEGVHNGGYVPGAYLNAQDANHINPVLAAITATGIQMALWSSEPEYTAWLNEALGTWYDFSQTPLGEHADLVVLHQYGENEQGGSVDLDIASDAGMAVLWGPKPPAPPPVKAVPSHVLSKCGLKPGPIPSHASKALIQIPGPPKGICVDTGQRQTVGPDVWARILFMNKTGWILAKNLAPN